MSTYAYCKHCGCGLDGPWDLEIDDIIKLMIIHDYEIDCPRCGKSNEYSRDNIVDEFIERFKEISK